MHPLVFVCIFDCLLNESPIFKGRNLDTKHLMKIQCTKHKEKKTGKEKNAFSLFLFSLICYLYADLENWLAVGISACVS